MTNFRSEDERADLVSAARAMREAGMAMHEIAHELAVPVSTLFRWAAEGSWRGKDIAAARMRAVFSPSLSSRAEDGPRLAADPGSRVGDAEPTGDPTRGPGSPPCGVRDDNEGEDIAPPPMTPLEARAAGERAFKGAMLLMEAGELKSAGEAMRLAERMLLAARLLAGLPLPQAEGEQTDYRVELERRLARIIEARQKQETGADGENAGGYWPPDRETRDLDAEYGFTSPEGEEQSGCRSAS